MVRNIKPTQSKEETQVQTYQAGASRESSDQIYLPESRSTNEGLNTAAFGGAYPLTQISSQEIANDGASMMSGAAYWG
jgi:hypothetical protein